MRIDSLDALRAAAEGGKIRGLRGFGARGEENLLRILAEHEQSGPATRIVLSRAIAVADQIVGELRDNPAADRVEVAGTRGAGPKPSRTWTSSRPPRPRGDRERAHRAGVVGQSRRPATRARASSPTTASRSTCASSSPNSSATYSSTSPAPSRTTSPCAIGRAARHVRERVRDRRRREREDAHLRREQEVYDGSTCFRSARAARGQRRARRRGRKPTLPKLIELERPTRRPALPHRRLGRAQHPPEMAEATRVSASSTWLSPTTRRRTASATTCSRTSLRRARSSGPRGERASTAFKVLVGTELNIHPDGSLDSTDERAGAAGLGDRVGAHVVPDDGRRR